MSKSCVTKMKGLEMSDQYLWKKTGERNDLDYFLTAHEEATGVGLSVITERETPDFICEVENRGNVGVELTKIITHPETRQWHRLFGSGAMQCTWDIVDAISCAVIQKAKKLRKAGWPTSEVILVIQLFDNPLSEIHRGLAKIDSGEFVEAGFSEIWITDHSTIEAYGLVEVFALYPECFAGYYPLAFGRKPYG